MCFSDYCACILAFDVLCVLQKCRIFNFFPGANGSLRDQVNNASVIATIIYFETFVLFVRSRC